MNIKAEVSQLFDPRQLLDQDEKIVSSNPNLCVLQQSKRLSDIEIGTQFSYRGEVCVKHRETNKFFYNVESSSGLMSLHPSTMVFV